MSDPRIWGWDAWKFLHRAGIAFPEKPTAEQREKARQFFSSLDAMLPCPSCAIHYRAYFEKTFNDAVTESGTTLSRWIYDMHEHVNARFQVQSSIKFDDVRALVNKFPTRYIDLDTGDVLMRPRYTDAFGVSAPHEKEARAWLEANPAKSLSDRFLLAQIFAPIGEKQLAFATKLAFAALFVVAIVLLATTLYYALRRTSVTEDKPEALQESVAQTTTTQTTSFPTKLE